MVGDYSTYSICIVEHHTFQYHTEWDKPQHKPTHVVHYEWPGSIRAGICNHMLKEAGSAKQNLSQPASEFSSSGVTSSFTGLSATSLDVCHVPLARKQRAGVGGGK